MMFSIDNLDIFARFTLVFTSLFVIIEPFGAVPAFVSLTKGYTPDEIKRVAWRSSLFGFIGLVFFSVMGSWLFKFLQIDMNAFRAAGGLLLLLTALDMLRGHNTDCIKCSHEEMQSPAEREDISIVPVAIPMLAGPGAITSIMVFSNDHSQNHAVHFLILLAALALVFVITYFVFKSSLVVKKILGQSGISATQRIMGILLAAISLQFISQGVILLVKNYWG